MASIPHEAVPGRQSSFKLAEVPYGPGILPTPPHPTPPPPGNVRLALYGKAEWAPPVPLAHPHSLFCSQPQPEPYHPVTVSLYWPGQRQLKVVLGMGRG